MDIRAQPQPRLHHLEGGGLTSVLLGGAKGDDEVPLGPSVLVLRGQIAVFCTPGTLPSIQGASRVLDPQ